MLIDARLARIRGRRLTESEAAAEQEFTTRGTPRRRRQPDLRGRLNIGTLIHYVAPMRFDNYTLELGESGKYKLSHGIEATPAELEAIVFA